jgi:hypothetical protein
MKGNSKTRELYYLLIDMAKEGINKLIRTYNETDKVSLLHTLQMYKTILDNPDILNKKGGTELMETENLFQPNNKDDKGAEEKINTNIDDIFIRITGLYTPEHIQIIYNTLLLSNNNKNNYNAYIEGLNKILEPMNIQIKKWIDDNIVF